MSHAKCSPSALSRRMSCPGSLEAEDGLPDTPSKYAQEGTLAHEFIEAQLTGSPAPSIVEYPDMHNAVWACIHWVNLKVEDGWDIYCEESVNPVKYLGRPDCFGTADIILIRGSEIIIADYKHGKGVPVDVQANTQLLAYAAGAVSKFFPFADPAQITMAIIQPRIAGREAVQEWTVNFNDIASQWSAMEVELAEVKPGALRTPGDHCRWCRAKTSCPERLAQFDQASGAVFAAAGIGITNDPTPITVDSTAISEEKIAYILDLAPQLLGFIDDMRDEARKRIQQGDTIPGYKLVRSRSNRSWVHGYTVMMKKFKSMKLTLDECAPRKMGSPAQIEKTGKLTDIQKTNLAKLWETKEGGLKLVVETAAGEAYVVDSAAAFESFM